MRIVVYPHDLVLGGSPINAVDLAAAVRDLDHDVSVYGVPGPLVPYIEEKGLTFHPARTMRYRPAPSRIAQLALLARRMRVDVIHAYEWPPALDAFFGAHVLGRVATVCTVLSMHVPPLVPRTVPLIMGTRELAAEAERSRGGRVDVIEPPVDIDRDRPDDEAGRGFRRSLGIGPEERMIVCVSRLSTDLKLAGLVDAVDAAAELARTGPVRLVLVGDGDAAHPLRARALTVNQAVGREVVVLTGALDDPRPAYAAADVVIGMGSTVLRGMAHAKPVVVQGEAGFSLVLDELTWPTFEWQGFFGHGPGGPKGSGGAHLAGLLAPLLDDVDRRNQLGRFGRDLVAKRFSLEAAARRLESIYLQVATERTAARALVVDAARVGGRAMANEARLHLPSQKRAGREARQRQLAATATASTTSPNAPSIATTQPTDR